MQAYIIRKEIISQYSAVLFANSLVEAEEILISMPTDLMEKQEYETETSKWAVNCIQWEDQNKPIAIQTKKGFKFIVLKEEI